MNTLTQNPNPATPEQEATLVAFVKQDLSQRRLAGLDTHLIACIAVRALNTRGWLSKPEKEVVPFLSEVETGSGIRTA